MSNASSQRIRLRQRVTSLPEFATGCTRGASGDRSGQLWIDRLQLKVDGLRLRCGSSDIQYLKFRSKEKGFKARFTGRSYVIEFDHTKWLFTAKITFTQMDQLTGSPPGAPENMHGAATINLNPTRLLAHIGQNASGGRIREVHPEQLAVNRERTAELSSTTLDGKDNYFPDDLIPLALRTDWPAFVEAYACTVRDTIAHALGRPVDASEGFNSLPDDNDPLVIMPEPHRWNLKQAEYYREYRCFDANELVSQIEPLASSASRGMETRTYAPREVRASGRVNNSRCLSLDLGRNETRLAVYAKTFDRLRVEFRFNRDIGKICRFVLSDYRTAPGGMSRLLKVTGENAMGRLNEWFALLNQSGCIRSPNRVMFFTLVASVSAACRGNSVLAGRVWSLLVANQCISPTTHPELSEVSRELLARGILEKVSKKRGANLRLASGYAEYARLMERIEAEFAPKIGLFRKVP